MNLSDVIIKPIVTEKSTVLADSGKYVFKVASSANKLMVMDAIESIFKVRPVAVNVSLVRSKLKRNKYTIGVKSGWKKAIVTLKKGDKIELFDK